MTPEFKAVTPERAVEIMRAWAFHSWPMSVQDGIDVCTGLGSAGDPRDPESFVSDMRDRLLGSGALPLSSSVPGAQPVRTACRAAAHSRSVPLAAPLPAAGPYRLPRRTGGAARSRSVPFAAPHRGSVRRGALARGRVAPCPSNSSPPVPRASGPPRPRARASSTASGAWRATCACP